MQAVYDGDEYNPIHKQPLATIAIFSREEA